MFLTNELLESAEKIAAERKQINTLLLVQILKELRQVSAQLNQLERTGGDWQANHNVSNHAAKGT